ncbi:hypothetical protein FKM82_014169 [Ascaphus truei]
MPEGTAGGTGQMRCDNPRGGWDALQSWPPDTARDYIGITGQAGQARTERTVSSIPQRVDCAPCCSQMAGLAYGRFTS